MASSRVSAYSSDGRASGVGRLAQLPIMVCLLTPAASSLLLSQPLACLPLFSLFLAPWRASAAACLSLCLSYMLSPSTGVSDGLCLLCVLTSPCLFPQG